MTHEEFLTTHLDGKYWIDSVNSKRIFCRHIKDYLKSQYNLTPQEWYNRERCIDTPECSSPKCSNKLVFNNLSSGYNECCSKSCHNVVMNNKLWDDPNSYFNSEERSNNISKASSERLHRLWNDPTSTYNSVESLRKRTLVNGNRIREYNKLYQSKSRLMYLYIGISKINSEVIKIGISSTDSGRIEYIESLFTIVTELCIPYKFAEQLESYLLHKTENEFYYGEDKNKIVGFKGGISELRNCIVLNTIDDHVKYFHDNYITLCEELKCI